MREIIQRILKEELGVPKGIIESSKVIFDDFKDYFLSVLTEGTNEYNFVVVPSINIPIGDMDIKELVFNINIHEDEKFSEIDFANMGVSNQAKVIQGKKPRIQNKKYEGEVEFSIDFIAPPNWKRQDFVDYFNKKRSELVTSFSHELKHVYDEFKNDSKTLTSRIDYDIAKQMMGMFPPLRKLSFMIYYTHVIENLVRPSELMAAIEENEITKQDFINFIKNQKTYQYLDYGRKLTLDSLKSKLFEKIDGVENLLDVADVDHSEMSNEEKIDKLLELYVINMANKKVEMYVDGITENMFEQIFGFSGEKFESFEKYKNKIIKYDDNPELYFQKEISNINKTSEKLLRKLFKLYSLAK